MRITIPGTRAPQDMPAGNYTAKCVNQELKKRGRNHFAVLTFAIVKPEAYRGVMLLEWLAVSETPKPNSKYVLEAKPEDDLTPEAFVGKVFEVHAGFRYNDEHNERSLANTENRKAKDDFLRIHRIIRRVVTDQPPHIIHSAYSMEHRHQNRPMGVGVEVGGDSTSTSPTT